ncbi:WD40 repeat-like protein [Viridothelium virens]|uniref:WD40 repeat-like protein n=1 Tax=Viridothelium virens TaxID=1048519 RepID=A0A6A6GVT1_VIRVR|nr:WD40 repeat-like protein [Viridothelium virens]
MSRSTDPGHFFQTESSLTDAARKAKKSKNNAGDPIRLKSKILTIIADPDDGRGVYVAESAGTARRISLQVCRTAIYFLWSSENAQNKAQVYTGPAAPLAGLALSPRAASSSSERTLFAGCWDKTIWSWSTTSRAQGKRFIGHNDFVKAVICVQIAERVLLVSGGADAQIIVWDVISGAKLHTLKGHARGVLDLAVDPLSVDEFGRGVENVKVFSAGSEREIRAWQIDAQSPREIGMNSLLSESGSSSGALDDTGAALLAHETSVNRLFFPLSDASGDFWTASSDKTAKHIVRSRGWEADTVLDHPDFVRDVCYDEASGYIVTACRDEGVRVWDPTSGDLVHCFDGHFEEVTALVVLGRGVGQAGEIVSVSIDGTIRRWGLGKEELQQAKEDAKKEQQESQIQDEKPKASMLTEEEERELAELMEDEE